MVYVYDAQEMCGWTAQRLGRQSHRHIIVRILPSVEKPCEADQEAQAQVSTSGLYAPASSSRGGGSFSQSYARRKGALLHTTNSPGSQHDIRCHSGYDKECVGTAFVTNRGCPDCKI